MTFDLGDDVATAAERFAELQTIVMDLQAHADTHHERALEDAGLADHQQARTRAELISDARERRGMDIVSKQLNAGVPPQIRT